MSRARGNRLQNALAGWLRAWWPHAESAGAGRQGTDVLGTPGVVWECKTASEFKRDFRPAQWVAQARQHAHKTMPSVHGTIVHEDVPVVVYFPPGIGEANVDAALAIVPMHVLMQLLTQAGYTPAQEGITT
jgi:hypothetical protein